MRGSATLTIVVSRMAMKVPRHTANRPIDRDADDTPPTVVLRSPLTSRAPRTPALTAALGSLGDRTDSPPYTAATRPRTESRAHDDDAAAGNARDARRPPGHS